MIQEVKDVLARSSATLWQDIAGGIALMVLLIGGLHLPGVI
jgi:hypothetical protein